MLENGNSERGKLFRIEAGVVADQKGGLGGSGFNVLSNRRDRQPHIREGKIVGDQTSPAGSAEFDRSRSNGSRSAHIFPLGFGKQILELGAASVARTMRSAKRERTRPWYEHRKSEWCWRHAGT